MSESWWVNGEPRQQLPVDSRGLAYGDGLFETMRLIDGDIPLLGYHLSRLEKGANRLGLLLDNNKLDSVIARAVSASDPGQNLIKLICVRRGSARGYMPGENNVDLLLKLSPLRAESSLTEPSAEVCSIRLASQPALAGIKHLNRLEQVMASRELASNNKEGILLDTNNNLIEAISSNLILVSGNTLVFPDLSESGVQGVMQAYLRDHSYQLEVSVRIDRVSREQLPGFDEILLTNAVRGVRNLGKIGQEWLAGSQTTGNRLRDYLLKKLHTGFHSF